MLLLKSKTNLYTGDDGIILRKQEILTFLLIFRIQSCIGYLTLLRRAL